MVNVLFPTCSQLRYLPVAISSAHIRPETTSPYNKSFGNEFEKARRREGGGEEDRRRIILSSSVMLMIEV